MINLLFWKKCNVSYQIKTLFITVKSKHKIRDLADYKQYFPSHIFAKKAQEFGYRVSEFFTYWTRYRFLFLFSLYHLHLDFLSIFTNTNIFSTKHHFWFKTSALHFWSSKNNLEHRTFSQLFKKWCVVQLYCCPKKQVSAYS